MVSIGPSPFSAKLILSSLRLAESLGAETVTLTGASVAESLLHYAQLRNVTKIVAGKQSKSWKRLWRKSVLQELIAKSGDIEISAISGGPDETARETPKAASRSPDFREFAQTVLVVGVCAVISLTLRSTLNPVNLVMVYLLGVVAVAMGSSRVGSGLLVAERQFRKVIGHRHIPVLLASMADAAMKKPIAKVAHVA